MTSPAEVTLLFTDIEGSTRLWDARPDVMPAVIARHNELVARVAAGHGGRLVADRAEGDSAFMVFPAAAAAVGAALDLQRAMAAEDWPGGVEVRVRAGLHTGVLPEHAYYGPVVNETVALRGFGYGGQVLLSGSAAAAVHSSGGLPDGASLRSLGHHSLGDEAGDDVLQLEHPDLESEFPPLKTGRAPARHNLWERPGPLVGRGQDLDRLVGALRPGRAVTLVGGGGMGKTRLALEAAWRLVDDVPDGCWWVDLVGHRTVDGHAEAVAAALSVRVGPNRSARDAVLAAVVDRRALLVLDGSEQSAAPVGGLVADLVRAGPGLRVLVTGRLALGAPGEVVLALEPLATEGPAVEGEPPALSLLRDRLGAAAAERIGDESLRSLAARVGGVPLALEVLAARLAREHDGDGPAGGGTAEAALRVLTEHGEDSDPLLTTIAWSERLLDPASRGVFRRLSAFRAGFTAPAAEAVASLGTSSAGPAGAADVLDALDVLVGAALLSVEDRKTSVRLRLLDLVGEVAERRLEEAGEREQVETAHLTWAHEEVKRWFGLLQRDLGPQEAIGRFETEHPNLVAALERAEKRDQPIGALLASNLQWFWSTTGRYRECLDWSLRLQDSHPSHYLRGALRMAAAGMAGATGADAEADRLFGEAVEILEAVLRDGDPSPVPGAQPERALATAYNEMGLAALERGDVGEAQRLASACRSLREASGPGAEGGLASTKVLEAQVALAVGDLDRARALADEVVEVQGRLGAVRAQAGAGLLLAQVRWELGDDDGAVAEVRLAGQRAAAAGSPPIAALCGAFAVEWLLDGGRADDAGQVLAALDDLDLDNLEAPASVVAVLMARARVAGSGGQRRRAAGHLLHAAGLARSLRPAEQCRLLAGLADHLAPSDREQASALEACAERLWATLGPGVDARRRRSLRRADRAATERPLDPEEAFALARDLLARAVEGEGVSV